MSKTTFQSSHSARFFVQTSCSRECFVSKLHSHVHVLGSPRETFTFSGVNSNSLSSGTKRNFRRQSASFYSQGSKRIIISQRKSGKMLAESIRKWTKVVSPLITRPKQGKIKTPDASAPCVCVRESVGRYSKRALSCSLIY
jgi:hypothetical protein